MAFFRTIAARGITPEYRGKDIRQEGVIYGTILYFEHFEGSTVVGVTTNYGTLVDEYDLGHLEEVDVYA